MIERSYGFLQVSHEGYVRRVALNNPARKNAIGPAMVNELLYALGDAADDAEVRVIVLTGTGDMFCAGGDFSQMSNLASGKASAEAALPHRGDFADLMLAMTRSAKPIVARVNGHAMGGGLGLVAACHFAVASRSVKLGTPEIDVGLFPMMIMAVLRRVVPHRRLVEMMLLGQRFGADEGAAMGLVGRVVEPAELDAEVAKLCEGLASKSPAAVRLGLEAMAAQEDMDIEAALPMLRERLAACLATDDAREGLTAFLEKRKPVWTGR